MHGPEILEWIFERFHCQSSLSSLFYVRDEDLYSGETIALILREWISAWEHVLLGFMVQQTQHILRLAAQKLCTQSFNQSITHPAYLMPGNQSASTSEQNNLHPVGTSFITSGQEMEQPLFLQPTWYSYSPHGILTVHMVFLQPTWE